MLILETVIKAVFVSRGCVFEEAPGSRTVLSCCVSLLERDGWGALLREAPSAKRTREEPDTTYILRGTRSPNPPRLIPSHSIISLCFVFLLQQHGEASIHPSIHRLLFCYCPLDEYMNSQQ